MKKPLTVKYTKVKRTASLLVMVMIFVLYYIGIDPDTSFLKDLNAGVPFILTLNIFVIAIMGIILIEFVPDYFIDMIYGKEEELRHIAKNDPVASSNVMIAKSIRILAYAFIVSASIIAYNIN